MPPQIAACLEPDEANPLAGTAPALCVYVARHGLRVLRAGLVDPGRLLVPRGNAGAVGRLVENCALAEHSLHRRGLELLFLSDQSRRPRKAHLVHRHRSPCSHRALALDQACRVAHFQPRRPMGPPHLIKRFDGLYELVLARSAQEKPYLVPRLESGFFGIPDGEAAAAIQKCGSLSNDRVPT